MSVTKIIVNNSLCQVSSQSAKVHSHLRNSLRYRDQNVNYQFQKNLKEIQRLTRLAQSSTFGSNDFAEKRLRQLEHITKGLERKIFVQLYSRDNTFPTGLLPRVEKLLKDENVVYEVQDTRVKPSLLSQKLVPKQSLPPLRYYQKTAVRRLEEAHRGVIVMPTGTGKTVTLASMIFDLRLKTLIITPSKAITDMMMDTMKAFYGKGKVAKLNTKTKYCDKPINVVNIQALVKMDPNACRDVECVFIDEFHHSAAETYREVNLKHLKNCFYRIGLTATNFRNDGSDMALESVLSEVLYEYGVDQAIKDGFLVKPRFEIIENMNRTTASGWQKVYKSGIVENDHRNLLVADRATQHKNDSVIILVQQLEHGETLKQLIPHAHFIHGTVKDSERQRLMEDYRKGKIKCLIGTSVIGEGVDLPIAKVLIMAGGGKARSQVMQNVGRVLRIFPDKEEAVVYDFSDTGADWLEEHAKQRQEVYTIYG